MVSIRTYGIQSRHRGARLRLRSRRAVRLNLTWLIAGCLSALAMGCAPKDQAASESPTDAESQSAVKKDGVPIELTPVDQKGLMEIVQQHDGEVVLVDFWATWCGPCIEKLPKVVELHQKYADQGLVAFSVCIGIHTDQEVRTKAENVLQRVGGDLQHLISNHQKDEAAFEDFDLTQVPYYRLYGRDGALIGEFESLPEDLEAQIQAALAR